MTLLAALLILVVLFLLMASAVIFVIGPVMLLHPHRRGDEYYSARKLPTLPISLHIPNVKFIFKGVNDATMRGWFLPTKKNPIGTILYLHGVGDNKISGLLLAKVLHEKNFNVLMYDSRAHGESGGAYCTYGYYEKYDVQKAIDALEKLAKEKHYTLGKIGIFGTSMGAAIAIQAKEIETRIAAVVVEGCFTNLRTVTVDYQKRLLRLPWHFLRNIAMKRAESKANFNHRDVSPLKALNGIYTPILFIHGTHDTFIKYQYSEQLFEYAHAPKEIFLVEGAHHNDVHEIGGKAYEERVVQFFEKYLADNL